METIDQLKEELRKALVLIAHLADASEAEDGEALDYLTDKMRYGLCYHREEEFGEGLSSENWQAMNPTYLAEAVSHTVDALEGHTKIIPTWEDNPRNPDYWLDDDAWSDNYADGEALASAGHGTDEDYGYFGDDEY